MNKTILIVAAHPDDEVLGCGGTIPKLVQHGYTAFTLILGEGKTARSDSRIRRSFKREVNDLKKEAIKANNILGIEKVFFAKFPDNRFDGVDLLDIVRKIEEVKEKVRPEIIFTHHSGDLNIDHHLTFRAVLTAVRPMRGEPVKDIYSFEVPSSTEWNSYTKETAFIPNVFSDVADTLDVKIRAMSEYKSELREYGHPRSLKHIKEFAKVNGTKVGLEYCEHFILIRSIRMDF